MQDGLKLTSYLFSSMYAACAAADTPEMLEAADSSHIQMEGLWNKIRSKGKTAEKEKCACQPLAQHDCAEGCV